jgi:choline dehydrogenase-like flavoprotein
VSQAEHYEVLILGSGAGGKLLAWHMARSGRKSAVVERRYIGGSCPNIRLAARSLADLIRSQSACCPRRDAANLRNLVRAGRLWGAHLGDRDPLQCSETGCRQQEHPGREHERGGQRWHAARGQRDGDGGEHDRAEDRPD